MDRDLLLDMVRELVLDRDFLRDKVLDRDLPQDKVQERDRVLPQDTVPG